MNESDTEKQSAKHGSNLLKALLLILALGLITAIILFSLDAILPGFIDVLERGDQTQIEQYIRSFGSVGGALLGFLLQFIQILSVLFPGGPIQIAIGVVFGTFEGFAICLCGYVLANLFVFWSARKLGNRFDQIFSREQTNRLRFISDAKHPGFVVALACLIPLLPNGLVPYIAARTKISTARFFFATLFGCMPTLFLLCAIGNTLLMGNYLKVGLLSALLLISVIVLYLLRNRLFTFSEKIQTACEEKRRNRTNS
ncbi:MAG: VTT domain-containing protein [Eubacteriales bacterium]|nr:VTT domain-containing protein [Eubacteriales bacterium]